MLLILEQHTLVEEQLIAKQKQIEDANSKDSVKSMESGQHVWQPVNVLNVPKQLSGKIAEFISAVNPEGAPVINPTDNISQTNAMEAKEFIQQQLKKPLGPDHINTLEQLKIELENITHVHMMSAQSAEGNLSFSTFSFPILNCKLLFTDQFIQDNEDGTHET